MSTSNSKKLKIFLEKGGIKPTRAYEEAAGLDLYSTMSYKIPPLDQVIVSTKAHVAIPSGYVGFVKPRSGLAIRNKLDTRAGVIDADYRGEVKVVLYNASKSPVYISRGDKIAQLVVIPCLTDDEYLPIEEMDDTERGHKGFGSSDKSGDTNG